MTHPTALTSEEKAKRYDALNEHLQVDIWYRICTQANDIGLWIMCAIMREPDDCVDMALIEFNGLLGGRLRGMMMRKSFVSGLIYRSCVREPLQYHELRLLYSEIVLLAIRVQHQQMTVPELSYLQCLVEAVNITRSHPYWAMEGPRIVDALQLAMIGKNIDVLYEHVNRFPQVKKGDEKWRVGKSSSQ